MTRKQYFKRYILVGIVIASLGMAFWPHYYIRSSFDPWVTVLSNSKEAYVYFGRRTIGEGGSLVGIIFRQIINIYPQIYDKRDDLILIHIEPNCNIQKADISNFGFSGSIFPKNGNIYYVRGQVIGDGPRIWQWDGTSFVKFDDAKTDAILGSFRYTSDLLKAQGWEEMRFRFDDKEKIVSFPLKAGKCVLDLIQQQTNGDILQTIKMQGDNIPIPIQTVATQYGKSRMVSKQEYSGQRLVTE